MNSHTNFGPFSKEFITKCDKNYFIVSQILQSETEFIIKFGRYNKVWQEVITNCDRYYKVWQLLKRET